MRYAELENALGKDITVCWQLEAERKNDLLKLNVIIFY